MSFSLFSNNDKIKYGIKNYIADTTEDLNQIPKKSGDMTFVIAESKYYICNNQSEWVEAGGGSGPVPEGIISITTNGIKDVAAYAQANVNITPNLQIVNPITPTSQQQIIEPEAGYDGLNSITINAIPAEYIIPQGTYTITDNGNYDITNYSNVIVQFPIAEESEF